MLVSHINFASRHFDRLFCRVRARTTFGMRTNVSIGKKGEAIFGSATFAMSNIVIYQEGRGDRLISKITTGDCTRWRRIALSIFDVEEFSIKFYPWPGNSVLVWTTGLKRRRKSERRCVTLHDHSTEDSINSSAQ